uniref:SAM domain-containing protein n=1 Tax=Romanomermis culicivorax TaxID=13658 RepID=A0A915JAM4_ROMCU
MCARSLPSRHADAEVFVICHHTMEHAEHLKHHPCHVITEMPCTCPKMSTEQDQNELSPCKDSLTSASSSSCQNNTLSSNNNSNAILKNNGLAACPSTNHNDAQNSSAAVNSAFNSPLISRKLADLLSRRRKSSPNISATNRGNSGKDLERTMCGGRDHGADKLSEVQHWNYEDVNNFLRTIGMEKYQADFTHSRIDGCKLLQLDGTKLKAVGVTDNNDRALIKKRVKQMKLMLEKERKKETKKLLHIPLLDKDRRLLKR